jgi:hypothetical protein
VPSPPRRLGRHVYLLRPPCICIHQCGPTQ